MPTFPYISFHHAAHRSEQHDARVARVKQGNQGSVPSVRPAVQDVARQFAVYA